MTAHADVAASRAHRTGPLDLPAITRWNAAQERAKREYDRDPFAMSRASAHGEVSVWWRRARLAAPARGDGRRDRRPPVAARRRARLLRTAPHREDHRMTRQTRTPADRAQEALDVESRRVKRYRAEVAKHEAAVANAKRHLEAAEKRRDYLAQDPDLPPVQNADTTDATA